MNSTLSVVIPAFNSLKTLRTCLRSIPSGLEVLVVWQETNQEQLTVFRGEFPDVKFIICQRRSASFARNKGAALATGKYIAFLDADTYLSTSFNPEIETDAAEIFLYNLEYCSGDKSFYKAYLSKRRAFLKDSNRELAINNYLIFFDTAFLIVRKDYFDEIGGFREDLVRFEDREFGYRAQINGCRIIYSTKATATKIIDETLLSLCKKRLIDSYYQSQIIFGEYSHYRRNLPTHKVLSQFKSELFLIKNLDLKMKIIIKIILFADFSLKILYRFLQLLRRSSSTSIKRKMKTTITFDGITFGLTIY